MICPIVCLTLYQECMLMVPICIYPIGLVQSHFDYCSVVTVVKLCVINCSDSRTVRHAFSQAADVSILLNDLGWQNLETQRQFQKAVMLYKSLNGLAPDYMSSKFILRSDLLHSYNLRDSENMLAVPLSRTNYYRNSFYYSGAVLCNNLPTEVRQAKSLTGFRKLLTSSSNTAFRENRL